MTEHAVTHVGWEPASKGTMRIKCQCGWTEKRLAFGNWITPEQAFEFAQNELMFQWERHAYTPEERLILMELEGAIIPKQVWGS